ncbi:MAG: hypothetical protein PHS31_01225 [Victivallaceae bacterium]|nr:hypothetical protein [Victivallaceae bacterium]
MKLVLIGVGQLGKILAKAVTERPGFEIVGAVDAAPELHGVDLAELVPQLPPGIVIEKYTRGLLNRVKADAAIVTTVSRLVDVMDTLKEVISCSLPLVCTCEELSYPWRTAPRLAGDLDVLARRRGVAVLGAGVNPGFLMDYLPLVMSSVCSSIERIKISRIQDASSRRMQFQNKIGAGMTVTEFEEKQLNGGFGHIGLIESIDLLSDAFKWQISEIKNSIAPVIGADGKVAGIEQIASAIADGVEKIELYFRAAVGETDPHDSIEIIGQPSFSSRVAGGIHGDVASAAIILNAAAALRRTSAGLHTMADFPIPHWKL